MQALKATLALLTVLAWSYVSAEESSRYQVGNPDADAIRALIAAIEAATNRRDAAGVAATFTSDGDLWVAGGPRFSGPAEIRRNEEEFYRTPGFQKWRITAESIRFLTSDVALVDSASKTTLDSGETQAKATIVVVRKNGDWRIAAVRVMDVGQQ